MPSRNYENMRRELNRSQNLPLSVKRVLRGVFEQLDEIVEVTSSFVNANLNANQLISGGAVWTTGLTFFVTPCQYVIDGELYKSASATVTLDAADATHPRIDVIAVNADGTVSVVKGTAAANPAKPEVSPDTQVEVTFATIAATATEPTGVANTDIYKEDTEWTSAVSDATVSAAATTNPYAGTKHIAFVDSLRGAYVTLTAAAEVSFADMDSLSFRIKADQPMPSKIKGRRGRNWMVVSLWRGTQLVSNYVALDFNIAGFDSTNTSDYQFVSLPTATLSPKGPAFDTVRISVNADGGAHMSVDNMTYQLGSPTTDTSNYALTDTYNSWTSAQGSPIVTLTDGATVTCDLLRANVFELTLGGNRTMDFTNAQPGQHFTLILKQDATGSRTVTWDAVNDWAGATAPTLTTTANAVDVLSFVVDSSGNIHGSLGIADSS